MGSGTKKRTFEDLKKIKLKAQNKPCTAQKAFTQPAKKTGDTKALQKGSDDEEMLSFFNAMQGVTKLDGTQQGRETPAKNAGKFLKATQQELAQHATGAAIDFEWEYSAEHMQGYVAGLDSKVFQQLKAGVIPVQARLDLHGMYAEQAQETLLFFVRECYLQSKRCFLVITGKGKNSPGGQAVLRQELQEWLTKEPLRQMVLAFCSARPCDGGAGAAYVLLRKHKKKSGK